jgi:hypothetical protein
MNDDELLSQIWKEHAKSQKIENMNKPSRIEAERDFLKSKIIQSYKNTFVQRGICSEFARDNEKRAKVETYLNGVLNNHSCSSQCSFTSMRKGLAFYYKQRKYIAVGDVYICKKSSRIHLCLDHCKHQVLCRRGEGVACSLTGNYLGQEFSLATERFGTDQRIAGDFSYDFFGSITAPSEFNSSKENISIYDLLLRDCGSMYDVKYVLDKYNHLKPENINYNYNSKTIMDTQYFKTMKAACVSRISWKKIATQRYDELVMSKEYYQEQNKIIDKAHQTFMTELMKHFDQLAKEGKPFSLEKAVMIFLQTEFPAYYGVNFTKDIDQAIQDMRETIVECMVRMWEKVSTLELVKKNNIQFKDCVVGMLHTLGEETKLVNSSSSSIKSLHNNRNGYINSRESRSISLNQIDNEDDSGGLTSELFVDEHNKPLRISSIPKDYDQTKGYRVRITFIPKIKGLKLAPTKLVKKKHPTKKRRKSKSNLFNSYSLFNNQRGSGCKAKMSNTRMAKMTPQIMPSLKKLNLILNAAIQDSKTIQDLETYCMSNFFPNNDK